MTDFQLAIIKYIDTCPNKQASRWEIAQAVFPEKWKHRAGRAAIIGHIDRACMKIDALIRLDPEHQHSDAVWCFRNGMSLSDYPELLGEVNDREA